MNKKIKIILLVAVITALISTISYCSAPYDTETAQLKEMSKIVIGSGYILRNETVVKNDITGVFEPLVKDGVRVSKGSTVGTIISGNLDEELASRLEEVTARIEKIRQSASFADIYASDEIRIYSVLKDMAQGIRGSTDMRDYASAEEYVSQLNSIIGKSGDNDATARDKLLVSLEDEKYTLEQQLGGIRTNALSPAAGVFYTTLDGLEGIGDNEADVSKLSCVDIDGFSEDLSSYKGDDKAVAKICDTYTWYLAANISKQDAEGIDVGNDVQISIDEQPFVKASIIALNEDGADRVAIVIKSTVDVKSITEKRTVEFEIKKEQYSGIYVPSAAIRVVDDVTGVYIINQNGTVNFRVVNIIANFDDYYIVQNKYTPPADCQYQALKVYDNVLVNPESVSGVDRKE